MLRLAFKAGALASVALFASCAMPTEAPATSVCDQAAEHLEECAGIEPPGPISCDAGDVPQAERLLSMTCEELDDPKADGGLRCSWLGRKLGMCVRVANDEELLSRIGVAERGALDGPFEVLVWNVYKGEEESWDADMRAIGKGFELFMVQEFFLDEDSRQTFAETGDADAEWLFATSFFDVDEVPTGVATGALARSVSATPMRSPVLEPVLSTPKMALLTTYALAWHEEDLMVVNVHGINFRLGGSFEEHMAAVESAIEGHQGPMIMAGDFNTWSPGRLHTLEAMVDRLGLRRVEPEADERGFLKLDHVFTRDLAVYGARFVGGLEGSDHTPIGIALGPV
jgi:endonuclease/exonuclease/phosphatase (EEP) superfamily protein YafD